MPKFLEKKLKKQYGAKSHVPYAIMNKMGAMHGNKVTAKGEAMEREHEIKGLHSMKKKKKKGKVASGDAFARAMNK